MSNRSRSEERQRAKAAKQIKLVSLLGVAFLGVLAFQFSGPGSEAPATPAEDVTASQPAGATRPADATKAARVAEPAVLPRMDVAEIVAVDPFIDPEQLAASQPEDSPPHAAPQEERVEVPVKAVYGTAREAVALIGRDVVAEGERIDASVQISRIAPGRVTVRREAKAAGVAAGAER